MDKDLNGRRYFLCKGLSELAKVLTENCYLPAEKLCYKALRKYDSATLTEVFCSQMEHEETNTAL